MTQLESSSSSGVSVVTWPLDLPVELLIITLTQHGGVQQRTRSTPRLITLAPLLPSKAKGFNSRSRARDIRRRDGMSLACLLPGLPIIFSRPKGAHTTSSTTHQIWSFRSTTFEHQSMKSVSLQWPVHSIALEGHRPYEKGMSGRFWSCSTTRVRRRRCSKLGHSFRPSRPYWSRTTCYLHSISPRRRPKTATSWRSDYRPRDPSRYLGADWQIASSTRGKPATTRKRMFAHWPKEVAVTVSAFYTKTTKHIKQLLVPESLGRLRDENMDN